MTDHQTLLRRYHYDPLDRLSGAAALNEVDTQLFYRKNLLVTQIQGALHASLLRAADSLLAQQQGIAAGMHSTLLATDLQHSVLQGLTPGWGQALVYTAYGYHRPCSGPPHLPGFTGEHRDPVTGHYLLGNGYRAFNPVLMRFNSPDSLSPFAQGGFNAYAYCQGDPVNYRDPTGHIKVPAQGLRPVAIVRPLARELPPPGTQRASPPSARVTATAAATSTTAASTSGTATSSATGRPVATVRPVPRPAVPPSQPAPPAPARTLIAPGGRQFVFHDQASLAAMSPAQRQTHIIENLGAADAITQENRLVISERMGSALSMNQYIRNFYVAGLDGFTPGQTQKRIAQSAQRNILNAQETLEIHR